MIIADLSKEHGFYIIVFLYIPYISFNIKLLLNLHNYIASLLQQG